MNVSNENLQLPKAKTNFKVKTPICLKKKRISK